MPHAATEVNRAGKQSAVRTETKAQDFETARYIADMILELRNLAKGSRMSTLQGLLEISYYEAYSVAHKVDVPDNEIQLLDQLGEDARQAQVA